MFYSNSWPMTYEYYNRRINFLLILKSVNNDVIKKLSELIYVNEIDKICNKLKMDYANLSNVKKSLWNAFQNNIVDIL